MRPPLRVLLVGAGYFARLHAEAWTRIPGATLAGVCDLDAARAARLSAEVAPGAASGDDPAAMMAALAADVVDIAAPPPAHLALIRAALAGPARAVICQKPFCAGLAQAREAAALAAAAGKPLVVHENFRFQPWWRRIRDELAAGAVGAPRQIAFRLRPGDGQGPDAYLARQPYFQTMPRFLVHETAVHWIDLFRFLFGAPDTVFADLRRLNPAIAGEDAGVVLFGWDDGRRALFDGNRLLDHAAADRRRTMGEALIEGDAGSLTLDGFGVLRRRAFGTAQAETLARHDDAPGFGGDCVRALQAHVVAHLLDGRALENAAADYLDVIALEEAVYRSAETGAVVRTGQA